MSNFIVVDTDVFSCLWQGRKISPSYLNSLRGATPTLSFISIAEAHFGAISANWGQKKISQLKAAIRPYVVAPYTPDMAALWGKLKTEARKAGHALGQAQNTNDLWICTTAVFYGAPLMTNNVRHFQMMPGLQLVQP
ncbi:putative nucleic acid-binding protein [Kibdelosporangium banguiense]|uniref:Nucleic acid-binding protein n=1 Tax=Kibdelosporangium banguiense TaxID=1365924 RepID=A0ABS4TEY4_9PSEU|nr:type II toxin-antitoxin system VapC family toxin [Kibdelosporangium banguiense]MBP2322909.1 putative nucleic acid-binding protein [Kibdelosporangium banguiense]